MDESSLLLHVVHCATSIRDGGAFIKECDMKRITGGALAALLASTLFVVLSPPAMAQESSCGGVLSGGGDGPLTKTFVSQQPGTTPGTFLVTFRLTTPRPAGTYRVRDCVFVDANNNGAFDDGEAIVGSLDEQRLVTGGSVTATVTVTAAAGTRVCDRAALSGGTAGFTDKSNIVCLTLGTPPPPVIPEVPLALLLPLAAAALLAGGYFVMRRRERPAAA